MKSVVASAVIRSDDLGVLRALDLVGHVELAVHVLRIVRIAPDRVDPDPPVVDRAPDERREALGRERDPVSADVVRVHHHHPDVWELFAFATLFFVRFDVAVVDVDTVGHRDSVIDR